MIRRGFWLTTGAILGVTGYRKATRLARTLTGRDDPAHPGTASTAGPRRSGMTTALGRAAAAAGFVRDVREGMAEYWDLQRPESARNLESQPGRAAPEVSEQDCRES